VQNLVTANSFVPEKASRATPKRVNGPKRRGGKTAKAQSLPQNAPILTEFFGPMWLVCVYTVREHERRKEQQAKLDDCRGRE